MLSLLTPWAFVLNFDSVLFSTGIMKNEQNMRLLWHSVCTFWAVRNTHASLPSVSKLYISHRYVALETLKLMASWINSMELNLTGIFRNWLFVTLSQIGNRLALPFLFIVFQFKLFISGSADYHCRSHIPKDKDLYNPTSTAKRLLLSQQFF